MDIGTFNGIVTGILLVLFIAGSAWVFSRKRQPEFDAAARLALDDEDQAGAALRTPNRESTP